jgi:hypothetical protein
MLAGDLAARLTLPSLPQISDDVIRAISLHDAGWAQFDKFELPASDAAAERRPLSFLEVAPADFLVAWAGSIAAAENSGPVGGIMVSEHFCRLGRARLASRNDTAEDAGRLKQFLAEQSRRQARLRDQVHMPPNELERLTDVLQFCDLVSLYLCCGADQPVEFPQRFEGTNIHARRQGDAFLFTPAIFGQGTALGVSAKKYPGKQGCTLPFLLS